MSRVILKYRNIAQGKKKSIYLEFNPAIHDIKGNSVRYECLNLEIYTNPENSQQLKHNRAVEEIAETIRCERYLQLVRHDYSFLAKARLDEDFLEYFRMNGDCHGAKYKSSRLHFERFCKGQCKFRHQCEPMRTIPSLPASCQGAAAHQEKAIQELCKCIL